MSNSKGVNDIGLDGPSPRQNKNAKNPTFDRSDSEDEVPSKRDLLSVPGNQRGRRSSNSSEGSAGSRPSLRRTRSENKENQQDNL